MSSHQPQDWETEIKFRPSLKILKTKVGLSNSQLLTLTSNQCKFTQKIDKLNQAGVQSISYQKFSEALIYLNEAQKILEYAASCGKTIDRYLITTTLQNQACAYQRLWELQKSADYMEAIVYNLNTFIHSLPQVLFNETLKDKKSISYLNLNTFVSRRLDGVFYYLQYSAVSSQVNQHQHAINSANQAQEMLKKICIDCLKYEQIIKGKNTAFMEDLLKGFDLKGHRLRSLLLQTKQSLQKIENNKNKRLFNFDPKVIEGFMIGEVMQIGTLTIEEAKQKNSLDQEISQIGIAYKVFYLSICYFVLGTQLRLLVRQKYKGHAEETTDYKRSKIYHLYSIKIISTLIPYSSQYLRHIVKSFKKNYDIDLYSDDIDPNKEEISSIDLESFVNSQNLRQRLTEQLTIRKIEEDQNETLKKKSCLEHTKGDTLCSELNCPKSKLKEKKVEENKLSKSQVKKKKKLEKVKSQGEINVHEMQKKKKIKIKPKQLRQSPKKQKHKCLMGSQYCSCEKRQKQNKKGTKKNQHKAKSCSSDKSKSKRKLEK